MKKMQLFAGLFLMAGLTCIATGTEISLGQAERAVGTWAARGGAFGKFADVPEVAGETFEDPDTGAKMHVVRISGKGFAVTSTDDGIEPIVLFSDGDGEFVAEEGNPLWDLLRWDLAARAKALGEESSKGHAHGIRKDDSGDSEKSEAKRKWAELLEPLRRDNGYYDRQLWSIRRQPLLATSWNQVEGSYGGVYNLYTPGNYEVVTVKNAQSPALTRSPDGWVADALVTNEVGHYPVGCVAVAGGQVMNFWQFPTSAVPAKTVTCQVDGKSRNLVFHGTYVGDDGYRYPSYQWDGMGVSEPILPLESERVSRLLSDIGVACEASYKAKGTSISAARLATELKSTYGYANAVQHTASLSGNALKEVLIPNLDAGAPVVLGIGHAHAVVADGYAFNADESTFFLHINLGWGQATHLWYVPPNIDKYSSIDEIICNIFPDFTGVVLSGRVTGPHNRPVYKMNMVRTGTTAGAAETDTGGIYHFLLGAGSYQVTPVAMDGTAVADAKDVTLTAMSQTANGNRILDFQATNVMTVCDIAVGKVSKGTTFSQPFKVSLSCPTEGCAIHYTLDGSIPGEDDPVYDGPITIYGTTTLHAMAFAEGMECSGMLEENYTFVDSNSRDNFANARTISGASGYSSFSNAGYTKETGEPTHSSGNDYGGASAWAKWVAPSDGNWTFWLTGTSTNASADEMDTQLAIYNGITVSNLSRVAANDNTPEGGKSSRLSFHATKGTEYKIAMDTLRGAGGTLTLHWEKGFIHFVTPAYNPQWAPVSGGRQEMEINASTNWSVVGCSDWIAPINAAGRSGDSLVYIVSSNSTGKERTGYVTLQSGDSPQVSFTIRQHLLDFATTKEEALDRAWRENKRILLLWGREACAYSSATMFSILPTESLRALLDAGFVLWYSNRDRQSDAKTYVDPYYNSSYNWALPVLAIVDPQDTSAPVSGLGGYQSVGAIQVLLQSAPSWAGLPAARIELDSMETAMATVSTKVREWGLGASSATVVLETGSDAAFSSVVGTRTLGTVTALWEEQKWTFPTPNPDTSTFCRVRVSSGDWSVVSDVVEFVPVVWGFRIENGEAIVTNALYAKGKIEIPAMLGGCPVGGIGSSAFYNATNLTEVIIPGSVTYIGGSAFRYCKALTSVTIPDSVTSIGRYAFDGCRGLWDTNTLPDVRLVDGWAVGDSGSLSGNLILRGVRGIANYAFSYCSGLTSVTIPDSVTSIGDSAFRYCSSLTNVTLPASVRSIGDSAFCECSGLRSVTIGNGVTSIGDSAFCYCSSLTSVTIPDSVTSIGSDAFAGCDGLTSVTILGNVTNDWDYYGRPFCNSTNIATLVLGDKMTKIGEYMFCYCSALANVTIPDSVTSIGSDAFSGCSGLWNTNTLPGVRLVDGWAVGYSDSLSGDLILRGGRGIADYAFSYCSELTNVTIPDSVTSIGNYAFEGCEDLASVAIGNGVTSIGNYAFSFCGLTNMTIPDSVTSIGYSAFDGCGGLKTLYVPESWKTKYVGGEFWSNYASVPSDCKIIYYALPKTDTGVPYEWLEKHGLGDGTAEGYEAAANAKAANKAYTVANCYVAGLDPTNPAATFKADISFTNGTTEVSWTPDLNEGGTTNTRIYTVQGKPTMTNDWGITNASSRFFRVLVKMPK